MWRHLYRQDPRLYTESDLVLTYLRSFFYEDMSLAATILTPPQANSLKSVNAIIKAFAYRVRDFSQATGADVAAFEEYQDSTYADEPAYHTPGILRTEEEDQRAFHRINEAINERAHSSIGARTFEFGFRVAMNELDRIWRQRPFLITCSVPVSIYPGPGNNGIEVRWREIPVLSVPPRDLAPRAPSDERRGTSDGPNPDAKLDIVLGTFGGPTLSRAALVSRGNQVISCTVWGPQPSSDGMRQQVLTGFTSRETRLDGIKAFQYLPELIVNEDVGLRLNREHVRAHLNEAVDSAYQETALWHARDTASIDHCAELMKDKGVYALLGSTDMLKRAALLGLVASVNPYRNQIDQVFHHLGYDLRDTIDQLSQCWDRHGFPPRILESGTGEEPPLVPLI